MSLNEYKCPKCGENDGIWIEYGYSHPQRYDGISEIKCKKCGTRVGRWTRNLLPDDFHEPRFGEWNVYKICMEMGGKLYSACANEGWSSVQGHHIVESSLTVEYRLNEWTRPKEGKPKLFCYETFSQAKYSGFSGRIVRCIAEDIEPGYFYTRDGELRAGALRPIRICEYVGRKRENRSESAK